MLLFEGDQNGNVKDSFIKAAENRSDVNVIEDNINDNLVYINDVLDFVRYSFLWLSSRS